MARKKPRFKKRKSAFKGRLRAATKAFLVRPAGGCCQICGYNRYLGNLTFHHKDPTKKQFNISQMILHYELKILISEASKCIVACHNCHGEIHANLVPAKVVNPIKTLDYRKYKLPRDVIKWYLKQQKKSGQNQDEQ